jgi:thiamine kinase-like enzyme
VQPDEIVARVWPGRKAQVETLGGGITNHNFKVNVDSEAFVLRVGGKDTELLGIDRFVEHGASRVAAALGIGPGVAAFVEPEGYLVTRFISGEPIPLETMRHPQTIARAARTLLQLHDGPPIPGRFDSFRVVEAYCVTATARGVRIPDAYESAKKTADEIERRRGPQKLAACHNDLLNANFIDDGERIRIVDWEYAGMGDRFFDLANFSVNHEFGEEENEALLASYRDEVEESDRAALLLMRFMSDFREAMWGVVQQGISELEFDFVDYANEHFARLERTASEPAFREALEAAKPA